MKTYLVQYLNEQAEKMSASLLQNHVDHLKKLYDLNCLITCGPLIKGGSAILLMRAPDDKKLRSIVKSDPFIQSGCYQSYQFEEFIEATPENNWLLN